MYKNSRQKKILSISILKGY